MLVVESQEVLLEKAKSEESVYHWVEAARIYERIGEYFLKNELIKESARIDKKLGYVYSKAALTAESSEDYFKHSKCAIDAYKNAVDLFKQIKNKPMELECEASMLYVSSISQDSLIKAKEAASKSIELFIESSEHYSKRGDKESTARTLSQAAMILGSLILFCSSQEEVLKVARKGREISEKAHRISEEIKNIEYLAEALNAEVGIVCDMTIYNLEYQILTILPKRLTKPSYLKYKKYLKLVEDTKDYRVRAMIYNVVGRCYIDYAVMVIEEEKEQQKYFEKAVILLEKSVEFARKSKDKSILVLYLYKFSQAIAVSGRFDYLIKKSLEYYPILIKLSKVFASSVNFWNFFVNLALTNYYGNNLMHSQIFITPADKKIYAEKGIEYTNKTLKLTYFTPFYVHSNAILTNFYSTLTLLSSSNDKRDENANIMLEFAKKAEKIGKDYDERYPQPTPPQLTYSTALCVAYNTLADITENKSQKVENLKKAASALEKNKFGTIHLRLSIESKLSLGALYEEITILTKEPNTLIKAKEILLEAINESLKIGYTSARIIAYDGIARIEDRLGNYTASAKNYEKAKSSYSELLKVTGYEDSEAKVKEKIDYIGVWILIERAKAYHKIENHLKAKENYIKARDILNELPNFKYEASYYGAWALLEEAEQLSKEEKLEEAKRMYEKTKNVFVRAINALEQTSNQLKEKADRERIIKLGKVAGVRIDYCTAKVNLEEAKILERQSKHLLSAEKFALAASQFESIYDLFENERDRNDLKAISYLCRAWESLELAGEFKEPKRYGEAANLFIKANEAFTDTKLKLLASGNSAFCKIMELGDKFDKSYESESKAQLYTKIKLKLSEAASSYGKGGFKNGENWAVATSLYFDAMWNLIKAQEELNIDERKYFVESGSKNLKLALKLFHKAGYKDKEEEIKNRLSSLEKEERILISASNIIVTPSIAGSTIGIKAPSCPVETSQSIKIEEIQQLTQDLGRIIEISEKKKITLKLILTEVVLQIIALLLFLSSHYLYLAHVGEIIPSKWFIWIVKYKIMVNVCLYLGIAIQIGVVILIMLSYLKHH